MRLGLIVNPIAGIGGAVGLKGSDGEELQRLALELGAQARANLRARAALEILKPLQDTFELVTPPGSMGETVAKETGFSLLVIHPNKDGYPSNPADARTTAEDTRQAALAMRNLPVDLLLFAGGDGTARDIFSALGEQIPALGIPAGVKIHSAVFAITPRHAGEISAAFLQSQRVRCRLSEVVDLDEEAYRQGNIATRLYGFLNVPYLPNLVQNRKAPSPAAEPARLQAIAAGVIDTMLPGWLYIVGPGTTTRAIAERLGFPKTLVGVDVYTLDAVIALDASEARLLELLENRLAKIVVTPTGGQGFLFGRGSQPISPQVIRKVGRENILVVSLSEKLNALHGEPLLVDTGDPAVDELLSGYFTVHVGYREKVVYRVNS